MKILIVGGGGREHALAWRLSQSHNVTAVIASPGNPGIEQIGRCVAAPHSLEGFADLAEAEGVAFTVVGPEAPLVNGIVDVFRDRGLAIVGPTRGAARLEGSKLFAKEFFRRAGIPTARSSTRLEELGFPVVIKADALAAGKGVVIARNRAEADEALARLGPDVLLEEFLEGEEVSFIGLSDGKRLLPFAPTQDHKRAYDGDLGPNTGGMGAYCEQSILTEAQCGEIMDRVMEPALRRIAAEGHPFTGFLYAGLMMTVTGPKVLEFNVRLGDPETQALMMSLESDLAEVLSAAARAALPQEQLEFGPPSVCVVLAAAGYPDKPETGQAISGLDGLRSDLQAFHAGTATRDGKLMTNGGRVLGITGAGVSLREAVDRVYAGVEQVHFDGMHFRRDIAARALRRC